MSSSSIAPNTGNSIRRKLCEFIARRFANYRNKSDDVVCFSIDEVRERLERFRSDDGCKRFLVNRMGSTGSSWFAKLLNSHPDVFCDHEGVVSRTYPRGSYTESDILDYIQTIAFNDSHGAYKAIGDVGSAWLSHVIHAPSDQFQSAILLRHPIRTLNTRLKRISINKTEYTQIQYSKIRKKFDLDFANLSETDWFFLNDCHIFTATVRLRDYVSNCIRIEDLSVVDYTQSQLQKLTGQVYSADLIRRACSERVNVTENHNLPTEELFHRFSKDQRGWYLKYVDPIATSVGYSIGHNSASNTHAA